VAGYLPGATGNDLRRALRAQVAAGAHSIIAALPSGPATFLKTSHHERVDMSDAELTSGLFSCRHWQVVTRIYDNFFTWYAEQINGAPCI
jgi:hypothetical protein